LKISSMAVSLNVQDVAASSRFLQQRFGFREEMAADALRSLSRPAVDGGMGEQA
jgi:hypothetical protein